MENKIIVIDDDPTGSQTVHSCPLLTRWTPEVLSKGLDDPAPLFFILSNTRSLDPVAAARVTREICRNLKTALAGRDISPLFVSRSDSTLRGHFPVEIEVIAEELGPFDACFLVPAFFEAGRVTLEGVHYLEDNGKLVRTDETEFARDSVFGYSTSYLPDYVEEKTAGKIKAADVLRLPMLASTEEYLNRTMDLAGNRYVAVDSNGYENLRIFADALLEAVARGKRLYLRSAASIVSALAALPAQPVPPQEMWRLNRSKGPGVVVVGSHVHRTTEQLEALLLEPGVLPVELDVDHVIEKRGEAVQAVSQSVSSIAARGKTPVVYTSRRERGFSTASERLRFGAAVSKALVDVVRALPRSTSFLISKGGITSNDILSSGLNVEVYRVVGQIIAGCTVVTAPPNHRLPELPVVIFPGNVGGPLSLREVYRILNRSEP